MVLVDTGLGQDDYIQSDNILRMFKAAHYDVKIITGHMLFDYFLIRYCGVLHWCHI